MRQHLSCDILKIGYNGKSKKSNKNLVEKISINRKRRDNILNFRQVHLDFHTSEKIEEVGKEFSKKQFQEALKKGHINSITVFSKCHHGYAYHPSKANEMHPHLNFDLLAAQIDAAHEIGVKTPVYLSAGLDEKMARRHPEWLVRNRDESTTWAPDFTEAGYHKFCMSSPYLDYLCSQIEEVCEKYDADGIFLDIVGVQPCYCQNCVRERIELGMNPYDETDVLKHAEMVYERYAKRTREAVDKFKPGLPLFHNGGHIRIGRRDLAHYNTHLEIESLPTGGWGYDHFPMSARYCQGLGMEYLGMTGKFHTSWGEFGGFKHSNALRYESSLSIANGAKCSIGDQLAPSGMMDMVTYELIGNAYKELEEKEPWLDNVSAVSEVALLSTEAYTDGFGTGQNAKTGKADSGAARILIEGHYLFDVIDFESDFSKYKVIILPDIIELEGELLEKLKNYCKNGGKILASGKSAVRSDIDLGAEWIGESEYKPCYTRPNEKISGMGDTGYIVYADAQRVKCKGVEIAKIEKPYFNRTVEHFCSHQHAPNSGEYYGAGMTEGKNGIYIAWKIFEEYGTKGSIYSKQMVIFALDRLLGEEKILKTTLPSQGVTTLMRQDNRIINHLLYASPVKRGEDIEIVEDIIPIYDCEVSIKAEKEPNRVYLAPQMVDLEYTYEDGRLNYTVPKIDCHQMVVIEF